MAVAEDAAMPSKEFPSKFENQCCRCHKPILIGQMIRFISRDSKDLEHVNCPTPPAASNGEGPKEANNTPRVGNPVANATPPAASYSDAPIYTHHRTLNFWWQGQLVGHIEEGVSVKGRPLTAIEVEDVDARIRLAKTRNVYGELLK